MPDILPEKRIILTGGAGFIGSAVVRYLLAETCCKVLNFDKLTYAANLETLRVERDHARYHFVRGDICDSALDDTDTSLIAQRTYTDVIVSDAIAALSIVSFIV